MTNAIVTSDLEFSAIEIRIRTTIEGIEMTMFVTPIKPSSVAPPTNPASVPMTTPAKVAITPAIRPIASDDRVPYINWASTSWPTLSVPSGSAPAGGS